MREGIVLSLVSVALALFYNGVSGKGIFGEASPSSVPDSGGAAPEVIPFETARSLHAAGSALFVDSRHEFDYRLGHIAGAVNVPLKEADAIIAGMAVPKDRPVVVYCDGAECNSSFEIGSKLSTAGFTKVYVFFAGWSAWKEAGQPVAEGTP